MQCVIYSYLVCILITIGDVTDIFAITVAFIFYLLVSFPSQTRMQSVLWRNSGNRGWEQRKLFFGPNLIQTSRVSLRSFTIKQKPAGAINTSYSQPSLRAVLYVTAQFFFPAKRAGHKSKMKNEDH